MSAESVELILFGVWACAVVLVLGAVYLSWESRR